MKGSKCSIPESSTVRHDPMRRSWLHSITCRNMNDSPSPLSEPLDVHPHSTACVHVSPRPGSRRVERTWKWWNRLFSVNVRQVLLCFHIYESTVTSKLKFTPFCSSRPPSTLIISISS